MFPKVVDVAVQEGFILRVTFDDGIVTEADFSDNLWGPMTEALKDPSYFSQVAVAPELGTIAWPNGYDVDPLVLHGDFPAAPPSRLRVRAVDHHQQ